MTTKNQKSKNISVYLSYSNILEKLYDIEDYPIDEINAFIRDGYVVTEMNETFDFGDIDSIKLKYII